MVIVTKYMVRTVQCKEKLFMTILKGKTVCDEVEFSKIFLNSLLRIKALLSKFQYNLSPSQVVCPLL